VAEVEAAVDRDQAVVAEAAQGQHGAEQDAAVTPEHQRELARPDQLDQPVGQGDAVAGDGGAVADPGDRIELGRVGRGVDAPRVAGPKPLDQAVAAQRLGQPPGTRHPARRRRAQPEHRGGVEDGDHLRQATVSP
jgi:hypothetical protein